MLFLLTTVSFSANAKKDVMKVYDKGQDGGNRIYSVCLLYTSDAADE